MSMHQALYRKYRPRTFDDVCGQDHITDVLKYEVGADRVSHAYLFCGSRGTGKTSCAKILAKAVNCLAPLDGNPCGKCEACLEIERGATMDIVEMDAASNNGIDNIRDIRDEVMYTPAVLKKRVYIIDEVHMLSTSAFNALLKTLEEPPAHVLFILATTELHELPATIISRCLRFDFRRISSDVIKNRLLYIADKENIVLEDEAALVIAKQAEGGMRDAVSMLELCSGGGADVTLDRAVKILGVSGYEIVSKTAVAVCTHDVKAVFDIIAEISSSSKDITVFWKELISFWRDMLVVKYAEDPASYLDLTEHDLIILKNASDGFNLKTLVYQADILDKTLALIIRSPQTKRINAELALLKMSDPSLDMSVEALLSRIGELEDKLAFMSMGNSSVLEKKEVKSTVSEPVVSDGANIEEKALTAGENNTVNSVHADMIQNDSSDNFIKLHDVSDAVERIGKINSTYKSFLSEADIFVSSNGKKVKIITTSFGSVLLGTEEGKNAVSAAFTLAKISSPSPEVIIEVSGGKSKESPLDEILN